MRQVDVTPILRAAVAPAWFTARIEEHLVGTLAVATIAAATLLAVLA